ncbi:MAG: hypothetical protein M1136_02490 [Chloroflexi bacterium]|nr:hypothetical protein [Chloroflexota bacterium]
MERGPFCWEIKGCSEAKRASCNAYRSRKNCWEVEGTSINSATRSLCQGCPVILLRTARAMASAFDRHGGRPAKGAYGKL